MTPVEKLLKEAASLEARIELHERAAAAERQVANVFRTYLTMVRHEIISECAKTSPLPN